MSKTPKRRFGDIGEGVAVRFLMKHGFDILERNYLKPWGEIDIIAKKKGIISFVEVKTIALAFNVEMTKKNTTWSYFEKILALSRKKMFYGAFSYKILNVSPETLLRISYEAREYSPEEKFNAQKLTRIEKAAQTYLQGKGAEEDNWHFIALCVYLNKKSKTAIVAELEDMVL